jgi:cell division protein ZapA
MSEINVTIAGRSYRMACEDGQEDHLRGLAGLVDRSIAEMHKNFGEIGDLRLTVMGAILIADDLGEARRRIAELEGEIRRRDGEAAGEVTRRRAGDEALAAEIAGLAQRIEQVSAGISNHVQRLGGAGGGDMDVLD